MKLKRNTKERSEKERKNDGERESGTENEGIWIETEREKRNKRMKESV